MLAADAAAAVVKNVSEKTEIPVKKRRKELKFVGHFEFPPFSVERTHTRLLWFVFVFRGKRGTITFMLFFFLSFAIEFDEFKKYTELKK